MVPSVPGTPTTVEVHSRQGGVTLDVDLRGFFARERCMVSHPRAPSRQGCCGSRSAFLVVEIHPLAFNPVRRGVVANGHLTVEIDLEGEIDTAAEMRKRDRLNLHFPTLVVGQRAPRPDVNPTGVEYLIVAADPLLTAVKPLAEWKRRKGLTVEVVAMSAIRTTSTELEAFLQNRYDVDPDLTYVLLVGDDPMVPTKDLGNLDSDLYDFDRDVVPGA
jgi:hypothetical protein